MSDAIFGAIHNRGFVRVAAATPVVATGDPATNAANVIALAEQGDAQGVDLMVFPELSISSYAIDDLHLQEAMLDAVEAALSKRKDDDNHLAPKPSVDHSHRTTRVGAGHGRIQLTLSKREGTGALPVGACKEDPLTGFQAG